MQLLLVKMFDAGACFETNPDRKFIYLNQDVATYLSLPFMAELDDAKKSIISYSVCVDDSIRTYRHYRGQKYYLNHPEKDESYYVFNSCHYVYRNQVLDAIDSFVNG